MWLSLTNLVCVLFDPAIPTSSFNFIQLFLYLFLFFFLLHIVHFIRPVARLFKRGVHMCMGLITIMYSQQGLEYFLLLYYTISMYYCNMYNVLRIIKKTKAIKKQIIINTLSINNYLFVLYPTGSVKDLILNLPLSWALLLLK